MMKKNASQKKILKDLEDLYKRALSQDNLSIALKIKELQIKEQTMKTGKNKDKIQLDNLTDDEITDLIQQLSANT